MSLLLKRLHWALTQNRVQTHPEHLDPRLRGRTYAIPFDEVWRAAIRLASGGLPRWSIVQADDTEGVIRAESRTLVFHFVDDVCVEISLDANGQTRVDLASASRKGWGDLGVNARRIARFCHRLDTAISASPAHILPPAPPARSSRVSNR